jgi:4-hydroxy-tetrahydrodipicolinate synthase
VFKTIKENATRGKLAQAQKAQFELLKINGPMYEESNPVGVKYLLEQMGVCTRHVRQPLLAASPALQAKIKAIYGTYKRKRG